MDSTEPTKKVKQTFSGKVYSWYISNGYDRFLKLSGKVPASKGQYGFIHTLGSIKFALFEGFNIGVMIPVGSLVIDIDPRNGGLESFDRMLAEAYKDEPRIPSLDDLVKGTFTVRTGGGGYHLYYTLSPGVKVRGSVKGYPGVDLKGSSDNQYVVGPGSVHPDTKKHYVESSQPAAPAQLPAPLAPFTLVQLRSPFEAQSQPSGRHPLWGIITPVELATLLAPLDPLQYRNYDQWFALLAAAHHASGGSHEAMLAFIAWSEGDGKYLGKAAGAVGSKWRSLNQTREGSRPVATVDALLAAVSAADESNRKSAKLLGEPSAHSSEAIALARTVAGRKVEADLETVEDQASAAKDLIDWIEALPKGWRQDDPAMLQKLIDEISGQPEIHWPELCAALADRAGGKLSQAQIKKHVRRAHEDREKANRKDKPTYARLVADTVEGALKEIEESPGDLLYSAGQPFFYSAGVWTKLDKDWPIHVCQNQAKDLVNLDTKGAQAVNRYAKDAATSIMNERITLSTDLYYRTDLPNCVNLLNCTLWFSNDGTYERRPHCREDYLTTQIPYNYDPDATCQSFDKMLEQVFDHLVKDYSTAERDDFIRHLWELFGYIIQPNKDHAVAMFWVGGGQNGKSKIAEIISKLVGRDAVLSCESKLILGEGNRHGTALLEGRLLFMDDDVSSNAKIDDGLLKKVSKNVDLDVNPKNKNSRKIRVHTAALFIMNTEARFVDTSPGFVRRVFATYFNTTIKHLQGSPLPEKAIAEDMPGILNKAIAGLARLRQRKDFDLPKCAIDYRNRFLSRSVPLIGFWETLEKEPCEGAKVNADALYSLYRQRMFENGQKHADKHTFISALANQGVIVDEKTIEGWSFKEIVQSTKGVQ